MTIWLIDGPDAVGKSTYASKLGLKLNAPVIHFDKPTRPSWWLEYGQPVLELLRENDDVVCDRSFLGEMVWPAIFQDIGLTPDFTVADGGESLYVCGDHRQAVPLLRQAALAAPAE